MNSKPSLIQSRKKFLVLWGVAILGLLSILFLFNKTTQAVPTVTHFWVGSSGGNWSDGTKWSLSSGGAPCNCIPGVGDVAGFDGNANGPVSVDGTIVIDSMYFMPGYTNTFTAGVHNINLTNDLYVSTGVIVNFGTGTWTISDDVVVASGSVPTLNMGDSTILLGGDWNTGGATMVSDTSTLSLNGAGLNQNIFGNSTFYNLTVSPNNTKFVGFQEGTTTTILGTLTLDGSDPDNKVHIQTVSASGIAVSAQSTIVPSGSVSISHTTVQYNTNAGTPTPLATLSDEVVEMVPFSTSGWFPVRGPGGITSNIETWSLIDSVPLNQDLEPSVDGDTVRQIGSVFGSTVISQADESSQPLFTSNAFNFNPALTFDGINDFLYSPDGWTGEAYYLAVKTDRALKANLTGNPSFFPPISWLSQELCYPAGGFVLGGPFTAALNAEVITHAVGGSGGDGSIYRTGYAPGGDLNQIVYEDIPHVYASIENEAGDYQDLFTNGKSVANIRNVNQQGVSRPHINFANDEFYLGSYLAPVGSDSCAITAQYTPTAFFDGQIGEIISFTNRHNDADRQKVVSYLSLKYGTTLDQSTGGQSYIASDGSTLMWDQSAFEAGTYDSDIAGIGQDNASALYQPKSHSVNKDTFLAIGNPSDLENMEFLTWGNDDGAYDTWLSSEETSIVDGFQRIERVWQAQETGEVGAVNVFLDDTFLPTTLGSLFMFVDEDTDFTDADVYPLVYSGGEWQLGTNYNFEAGEYFTFGFEEIVVEFEHPSLAIAEDTISSPTSIMIQGQTTDSFSLGVFDATSGLAAVPPATEGSDYTFNSNPQLVSVPVGDYSTFVATIPLDMSVIPDDFVETNEYMQFIIGNLPEGVVLGDIDGDGLSTGIHNYTIINDDSANVLVAPTSIQMAEGGSSSYTVVLTSQPTPGFEVLVDVMFGNELETGSGTGQTTQTLTFTSLNWSTPQTVLVWAVEDQDVEGTHFDITSHTINPLTSDSHYLLVSSIQNVDVEINDNDVPEDEPSSGNPTGCANPNGCFDQDPDDGDDVEIPGCTNPNAINFNYAATEDDGSCVFPIVLGDNDPPDDYVNDAFENVGECPFFSGFYRLGSEGSMVARWQAFLNVLLGTNLTVDGRFGPATDIAVKEYHDQWKDIILRPWGHTTPTGYIYKTTNATGNSMIGCPLGTVFISETGEYFNADTYNSAYNLQELTDELRNALNIQSAELLDGYGDPLNDYTQN